MSKSIVLSSYTENQMCAQNRIQRSHYGDGNLKKVLSFQINYSGDNQINMPLTKSSNQIKSDARNERKMLDESLRQETSSWGLDMESEKRT